MFNFSKREKIWTPSTEQLTPEYWAETNAENAKNAADLGLPALTGSEKQVAWAETLRIRFIKSVTKMIANAPADAASKIIGGMSLVLAEQTEAKWWIDSREDDLGRSCGCHTRRDALRGAVAAWETLDTSDDEQDSEENTAEETPAENKDNEMDNETYTSKVSDLKGRVSLWVEPEDFADCNDAALRAGAINNEEHAENIRLMDNCISGADKLLRDPIDPASLPYEIGSMDHLSAMCATDYTPVTPEECMESLAHRHTENLRRLILADSTYQSKVREALKPCDSQHDSRPAKMKFLGLSLYGVTVKSTRDLDRFISERGV